MTIFKFALTRAFKNVFTLIITAILPIGTILIRTMWEDDAINGFMLIALFLMIGAVLLSNNILKDKVDGVIPRILLGPVTMTDYFFQNLLACMIPLTLQSFSVGIIGVLLHDWTLSFGLALGLSYTLFSVAMTTLCFSFYALFREKETGNLGILAVTMMSAMLGGLTIPKSLLPITVQRVGALLPPHWISRSIYSLNTGEITLEFWIYQGILVLFAVIFLLFGGKRRMI